MHPKLSATAVMTRDDFADRLDQAISRSMLARAGKVKVIEAKPVEHAAAELKTPPIRRRV